MVVREKRQHVSSIFPGMSDGAGGGGGGEQPNNIMPGGAPSSSSGDGGGVSDLRIKLKPAAPSFQIQIGGGGGGGSAMMPSTTEERQLLFLRHDSTFSVNTEYDDGSPNNLNVFQGAALLTADCLGTGLLALPGDIQVLGYWFGLAFLIVNLPINLYAGTIFHYAASAVENEQEMENKLYQESVDNDSSIMALDGLVHQHHYNNNRKQRNRQQQDSIPTTIVESPRIPGGPGANREEYDHQNDKYEDYDDNDQHDYRTENALSINSELTLASFSMSNYDTMNSQSSSLAAAARRIRLGGKTYASNEKYRRANEHLFNNQDTIKSIESGISFVTSGQTQHAKFHHDTATFDFIGMTRALFPNTPIATRIVMAIYYTNIFLVLGNYVLVMSHAVSAMFGGDMCYPTAGLVASIGMFIVSQSRTMANLGRVASFASLAALLVVVVQCLWAAHHNTIITPTVTNNDNNHTIVTDLSTQEGTTGEESSVVGEYSLLRKLSALGSIGFAVGSQKLFLNIRHELGDRSTAPRCLGYSLSAFGTFYVLIVVLAGTNPPSFLFDAIAPGGWSRRLAGSLLWAHVVVSYAINSQAICSSMDRLVLYRVPCMSWLVDDPAKRWMLLTGIMAITAYTVANAVPFFKDLVSLIGALTSVPLTLLLPAVFWRKHLEVPLWLPTWDTICSYSLTIFAIVFLVAASIGSFYSIEKDWSSHGAPFSCH